MLELATRERQRIEGHLVDMQAAIYQAQLMDAIEKAIRRGELSEAEAERYWNLPFVAGGAVGFYITNAEAISMLTDFGVGVDAGTAAVIQGYSGSVPADADAANGGTLLFTCTASATAFSGVADNTPGALATFDTITDDSSADNTGTAAFFRISTQDSGTVVAQGTIGTSSADLILNTVSITSGSTVSITSATIELEEGP